MTVGTHELTLLSAADALRSRRLSSVELTEAVLERIRVFDPGAGAFITVMVEEARRLAREADSRPTPAGPLEGLPISLKDLIDVRGVPTTAGSRVLAEREVRTDAPVVSRLRDAGAVLVGKTNLHECAYGVTGANPHFGPARNPWHPDCVAGGSSSGSAVSVVMGMALGSVGTDTGGSIRIPAALCGAVGFKPTYGRIDTAGVVPLAPSFDHVGPITRTVRDAALMTGVMAHDGLSDLEGDVRGLRLGVGHVMFERLHPEVRQVIRAAVALLEKMGAVLVEVEIPGPEENEQVFKAIAGSEVLAFHEPYLERTPELYGAETRERMEAARSIRGVDYVRAQQQRRVFREQVERVFEIADLIVSPAVPIPAPRLGAKEVEIEGASETVLSALTRNTRLFSTIGIPAISVPCGFTSEGLPVGLQIAGPSSADARVLGAADAYEQEAGWSSRRPPEEPRGPAS